MEYANLPKNRISKVIIGKGYDNSIYKNLEKLGITPLFISESTNVRKGIHNHADLAFCPLSEKKCLLTKEQATLKTELDKLGIKSSYIENNLGCEYPNDVLLNCVVIGKRIILNPKTVSKEIIEYSRENHLIEIPVKQGYTKCSIAPVTVDSFITDDASIGSIATDYGFDVLIINKGQIKLKNFNYGFIGGATGKIAEDKMVITGKAELLDDYKKIKSFLYKYDVELISLSDSEVEDVGSIFPII